MGNRKLALLVLYMMLTGITPASAHCDADDTKGHKHQQHHRIAKPVSRSADKCDPWKSLESFRETADESFMRRGKTGEPQRVGGYRHPGGQNRGHFPPPWEGGGNGPPREFGPPGENGMHGGNGNYSYPQYVGNQGSMQPHGMPPLGMPPHGMGPPHDGMGPPPHGMGPPPHGGRPPNGMPPPPGFGPHGMGPCSGPQHGMPPQDGMGPPDEMGPPDGMPPPYGMPPPHGSHADY